MKTETLLCFDLGQKRIGIAVGQTVTKTATPLETIAVKNNKPDWPRIGELIDEWQPDRLIVGYPLQMDDGRQPMTEMSERFVRQLDGRYHLPVDVIDERLSSYEARQRIKSTRNVDPVAAQAILETWFEENQDTTNKETDRQ
ncbi:MAG: Holliday junction resolvase RuvX [Gammaproteobacteria bacterium]